MKTDKNDSSENVVTEEGCEYGIPFSNLDADSLQQWVRPNSKTKMSISETR